MMHEMEIDVEVPMSIKVKFSVQPEEKMTRHHPGCPAHIDDLEFVLLFERVKTPLKMGKGGLYEKETVEVPVECGFMNDTILNAHTSDEWQDMCFEDLIADEESRMIDREDEKRLEDLIDDPFLEAHFGGDR